MEIKILNMAWFKEKINGVRKRVERMKRYNGYE